MSKPTHIYLLEKACDDLDTLQEWIWNLSEDKLPCKIDANNIQLRNILVRMHSDAIHIHDMLQEARDMMKDKQ